MKYVVKVFEERKQHELRKRKGMQAQQHLEEESFIYSMDAMLVNEETGSKLSTNLVLSNHYVYVIIHDFIRYAIPFHSIVGVKERTEDDGKYFTLTIRRPLHELHLKEEPNVDCITDNATESHRPAEDTLLFAIPKRSAKSGFLVQLGYLLPRPPLQG